MDDHQPSWDDNGAQHLVTVVKDLKPNTSRINFFLPVATDALARPVDGLVLSRALVENFTLSSLELYRCNLTTEHIASLAQALSVNKYVTYLGLARNRFYTAGGVMLSEMLKVNQTIVTIDLSWNELRDEFAISAAEALTMNNSIQRLIVDKNKLTGDGLSALSHAFSTNRKLRYISLSQNMVTAYGLSFLGKAIASHKCSALQTLDVSANAVTPEGMFSFLSSVATMPRPSTLVTLNLAYNKLGTSSLVLGSALMKMPSLRELNVEYCLLEYTPELKELCRALAVHKSLVNINVSRNALGNEGLDCICEALAVAGVVKYCDFSDCGMSKVSLDDCLLKLLQQAKHLETLHLSDNNFSEEDAGVSLAKMLSATQSLSFLGLQRCKLGLHGMDGLCTTLQFRSPSIRSLSLRGNRFGDAGFAQLLPFVLHHAHFSFLDVAQNDLTSFIFARLPDVFQSNCDLPYLIVEDDIVVTKETVKTCSWDDVAHKSTAPPELRYLPPLVAAEYELQTGLPPSAGFATHSAAIGSVLRRQVEETANLVQGLVAFAGQAVKHCHVWRGNDVGVAPKITEGFKGGPSDPYVVSRLESNIGGLLLSDDQLRREFNRLDSTGSGFLPVEDFKKIYRRMEHYGVERSEAEVDRVLRHYGGGQPLLSFDIFCLVMLKLAQH